MKLYVLVDSSDKYTEFYAYDYQEAEQIAKRYMRERCLLSARLFVEVVGSPFVEAVGSPLGEAVGSPLGAAS